MGKHLVIVGGGHAHLKVLKNLNTFKTMGNDVTVVSANAFHYYSGMGPGLLSGIYRPQEVRFNIRKMVEDRGGIFIENKAVKIDPEKKQIYLQTGDRLEYDVASFNTGSFVPLGSLAKSDDSVVPMKPIKNLLNARQMITEGLKKKIIYHRCGWGSGRGRNIRKYPKTDRR
jgi:NADH dehydrogenase FAD-containing subunit